MGGRGASSLGAEPKGRGISPKSVGSTIDTYSSQPSIKYMSTSAYVGDRITFDRTKEYGGEPSWTQEEIVKIHSDGTFDTKIITGSKYAIRGSRRGETRVGEIRTQLDPKLALRNATKLEVNEKRMKEHVKKISKRKR